MRPSLSPIRLLAALIFSAIPASAAPLITEFLANNNTGIVDENMIRQDWIEIYNPGPGSVDLGGYHLSDDSSQPTRWTFPSGVTLAEGAYLVVFASGEDRAVAGQPLHTNFSLAAGGEFIGLYAPGGALPALSEFTFGQQSGDVSYGLLDPVAGSAAGFFTTPTPGTANNSANAPADAVVFSPASRTFNQGSPLTVTLSTPSPTAVIRYTINRGAPIAVEGIMGTFAAVAATDVLTLAAHGFSDRDEVQLEGVSTAGLGQSISYFVVRLDADTIKVSDEPGGLPVDITVNTNITLRRDAARFTATAPTPPATSVCTSSYHRFSDWDPVRVTSAGTLPGGLAVDTTYYIVLPPANGIGVAPNFNTYGLSATPGGTAMTFTSIGTGTHIIRRMPSAIYSAPLTVSYSQRIRARAYEAGRPDGPKGSESYLALDAAAQAFTSNIPIMILHSWGSQHPWGTTPTAGIAEDTKQAVWFVFEPKPEGANMVARLTNPPDLATPAYFERRGSSTFGATKYSMTMGAFNESSTARSVAPLGFASNDDFVLNAPFQFDLSLMHNDLIYRLSNEVGRWAPMTRHVELFMSVNNDTAASGGNPAWGFVTGAPTSADYYGVYSFQDKISRGANRIDIEDLNPTDNTAPAVQGGYIFKIDRLDVGDIDVGLGGGGRTFALVQPKEWTSQPSHLPVMTNPQKAYLSGVLNAMYTAVQSPNFMNPTTGYAAHLDVPAAIDHLWLSALPKSADAFRLSGFWHKSRFGKLVMGPIFDYDRAMGSADQRDWDPRTWRGDVSDWGTDYFHNASIYSPNYFHWMFMDPNFWQATIDRYEELRQGVLSTAHVHALVDEYTELLDPGNSFVNPALSTPARRNQQKFGGPRNTAQFRGTNGHFRGEAQWLKNWWAKSIAADPNGRFDFIDGQFMRPPAGSQPSGPVAAGSTVALSSPSQSISGVKIYYTTDGTDPRAPSTTSQALYQQVLTTLGTLLPEISTVRAIVPTSNATGAGPSAPNNTGAEWRGADLNGNGNNADDFDDSGWFTNAAGAINGVGYDNDLAVSYLPYIGVRWHTPANPVPPNNSTNTMFGVNGSCYSRHVFNVTAADLALIATPGNRLAIAMRYDDGFVAWINGTKVTNSANFPGTPAWNTILGTSQEASLSPVPDFNITAFASTLHVGTNILAIHGINGSTTTSSDLVIQPQILIQGSPVPQPPYTPSLTPGATEYTGALTIDAPTQIFARSLHPLLASDPPTTTVPPGGGTGAVPNGSSWSGPSKLYYFPGAVAASQASIKITEVLYHPSPPTPDEIANGWTLSNDFEFVRLTNTGAVPVDLTGIFFSNGLEFTAAPGLQNWLPAGQSVVVVENTAAFISRYGATFTILGEFKGELDDGGEHIVLNDKTGAVISDFIYGDDAPWPVSADEGHSLLYLSGDQTLPGSWQPSADVGGTGVNSYNSWVRRYFPASEVPSQTMDLDDDGDGLNNLGEYLFATDPRLPGTGEHTMAVSVPGVPARLAVRRRSGVTDAAWSFETATNLTGWTTAGSVLESVVSHNDGTETATWRAPDPTVPPSVVFMRAKGTSP